jgi:hypothetical protein
MTAAAPSASEAPAALSEAPDAPPAETVPAAAKVLRRALVGWGLGHVMLGDRRGWLLLIAQPIAIIAVAVLADALIDGTRWLVVFPPLLALMVFWIAQAIDAHQRAVKMGAKPGGEMSILVLLPIALVVLTTFWLLGGRHGSASATLEQYIEAWMRDRPEAAAPLFATPQTAQTVDEMWAGERAKLVASIGTAYASYGDESGLDPDHPFDSLRFRDPVPSGDGGVSMVVELVRNERVQTTVLGVIPTASQQEVVVERDLTIWLEEQPQSAPPWLPFDGLDSYSWKITSVDDSSS